MTTKSTDLVVTIDGAPTSLDVLGYLADPSKYTFRYEEDPTEIAARIEAETLAASSADDLFGEGEAVLHARDVLNKPLQFLSVSWRPSDLEGEGLPFYALFRVTSPDLGGSIRLLSCGARTVVLKAARCDQEGWFPRWLKFVEVEVKNPVKGRSKPLDLVAAPDLTPATLADGSTF